VCKPLPPRGTTDLLLKRDHDEAEHHEVVDDGACEGQPHVLEVPGERVLELDVAAAAANDAAAAEQLANDYGARGLDRRARVVQMLERHHRVGAHAHLAGRTGIDGREWAEALFF